MNIPARYANGFLGDIGVPPDPAPMDYNAWFEAFLDGHWFTFDARHNTPRIGRITVARARCDGYPARYVLWLSHIEDVPGVDG
jgi:transglutaminase-like putative cysteine protease